MVEFVANEVWCCSWSLHTSRGLVLFFLLNLFPSLVWRTRSNTIDIWAFWALYRSTSLGPNLASISAKLSSINLEQRSSSNCRSMWVIQLLYWRSFVITGYLSTSLLERCQLNHAFSAFFVWGQTMAGVAVVFGVVVAPGNVALAAVALAEATFGWHPLSIHFLKSAFTQFSGSFANTILVLQRNL